MAPQISVIIPNYNHAAFLEQRIESVLNQTFQDYEVIILDDCSADNSKDIIERYRNHPKVSMILYNDVNSGSTFIQWEKGIEQAKGKWIWVAESDDWCEPTFLQEVYPDQTDNNLKDVVLSYCGSVTYRDNNILHYPSIEHMNRVLDGQTYVQAQMNNGNAIYNASSCLFTKQAYQRCPSHEQFTFSGDWFTWINIALQGNVKVSGKCLNYFRKHSSDVSGKSYSNGISHMEYLVIQKHLLDKKIIEINKYNDNIFKKYFSIILQVNKDKYKAIQKAYKEALAMKESTIYLYKYMQIFKRILRL